MTDRPLTPLMIETLDILARRGVLTGNEIGYLVGAQPVFGGRGQGGRGKGHRAFGPAQAVIPVIVALRRRGLIEHATRRDGLSGSADRITDAGRVALAAVCS